jgi:hypothetical protein
VPTGIFKEIAMPEKKAYVALTIDKTHLGWWRSLLEGVENKSIHDTASGLFATIPVNSYLLNDHQFIQVKVTVAKATEVTILLPRNMVLTIIEGKAGGKSPFSFTAGS